MKIKTRVKKEFFTQDALTLAPALLGMVLVCSDGNSHSRKFTIIEAEAYRGEEDMACHASKGRTERTEIMYSEGGVLYIYLVYGMHWMLNIVSGKSEEPQAVLIRGLEGISGPGRLTKVLGIDKSFNGEDLSQSSRIWLENCKRQSKYKVTPRIGIDYACPVWKNKLWRFVVTSN